MKNLQTVCLLFAMGGLVVAQQYTINTVAGTPQVPGLFPFPLPAPATGATLAPATGPSGGQLYHPSVVSTDTQGNIYIGDSYTYTVRMVNLSTGNISIIAGNGTPGNAGDKALATSANITDVHGIAVDSSGQVFFSDTSTCRIRRVDNPITTTQPFIWTAAGNTAVPFCGATSGSPFVSPGALAFDSKGNLYIADYGAAVVRLMTNTGAVSTFAGTGTYGYAGDGGPASKAELAYPVSLTFDSSGNLYIGDVGNNDIRKIDTSGNITTVASNVNPQGLGIDAAGNFYFVDGVTSTVRKTLPGGGIVTIAGNGSPGYAGDGGPTSQAVLNQASGLNIDPHGIIYVADTMNDIIRSLVPIPSSLGVQDTASEVPGSALEIGAIAPGEILTLFGSGLGPATLTQATAGANGLYPTQLAGTSVTFNNTPAPIIYTSSGLVTVVAPYEITGSSSANIALTYQGSTYTAAMPVVAVQPAVFTANASGVGQAAALNQDLSVNSAANPAHLGSTIVLYVNGAGYTTNPVDGQKAPVNCGIACLASPLQQVTVKIGNQFVTPSYAGAAPSLIAGVMQVNAQIPPGIIPGTIPVTVILGGPTPNGYPSQSSVNIAVIQ
jgi:uncharacterized protein (TIGR03437 family)